VLEDERLLARELAGGEKPIGLRREVHDRDEEASLPEAAGTVEEEELPRPELVKERVEAVEPSLGSLALHGREDEERDAAGSGALLEAPGDSAGGGGKNLVADPLRLEPAAEARGVELGVGRLEEAEDDRGEEIESREEAEVLGDSGRGFGHDVRVDRDRRELLARAGPEKVDVEARLRRAARALEETEDRLLRCELGAGGVLGRFGVHGAARIRRFRGEGAGATGGCAAGAASFRSGTSRRRR